MFGWSARRIVVYGTAAAVAVIGVAACGGGDDDTSSAAGKPPASGAEQSKPPDLAPTPVDPELFWVELINHARDPVPARHCPIVERVNRRSQDDVQCPVPARLLRGLRLNGSDGGQAYGSGAVVDYTNGNFIGSEAAVLVVAPKRRWAVARYELDRGASVGTSDAGSRPGFDRAVDSYLEAVRARDCKAYAAVVDLDDGERPCPTAFARTRKVAALLQANRDPKLHYMGGNRLFGFYGLTLRRPIPRYWTVVAARQPRGQASRYAVMAMLRGPLTQGG